MEIQIGVHGKGQSILKQDAEGNISSDCFASEIIALLDKYGLNSISNGFIGYREGKPTVEGVTFEYKE